MSDGCLKCGYVRKPKDAEPLTTCPSCGVVYAKVAATLRSGAALRDIAGRVVRQPPAPASPVHQAAPPVANSVQVVKRQAVRIGFWNGLAMVLGAMFLLAKCSPSGTAESGPRSFNQYDAFDLCKRAISLASKDPERADVPRVDAEGGYGFRWGPATRMLRLRNGLGLEVAATGWCSVDQASQRVTELWINGDRLVAP